MCLSSLKFLGKSIQSSLRNFVDKKGGGWYKEERKKKHYNYYKVFRFLLKTIKLFMNLDDYLVTRALLILTTLLL